MTRADGPPWPYLSPAKPGWTWVAGERGEIRRLVTEDDRTARTDPVRAVLDTIEQLDRMVRLIQSDLVGLVTEAYYRGASWQEIADRLDRSKQAVHQRYHGQVHTPATHTTLRTDLTAAHRWAREAARSGGTDRVAPDEVQRFLREFPAAPP